MAERTLYLRIATKDVDRSIAELKKLGVEAERVGKKIAQSQEPASKASAALDGFSKHTRGSLEDLAMSTGSLGAGLVRLGPAGLAAAAAVAGLGLAAKAAFSEAAKAEQSQRRLEAVLKATGSSAGLTSQQILDFSDTMERSTLATAEGVQDAAAVLATFRSVSGETFTTALALAQDLSAVFGQDLRASALVLGKALEDPIGGLTALRRMGVSFTQSQKDLIESFVKAGQKAEASQVIFKALGQQVGGAGKAEAGGLTGSVKQLTDAWSNLLEEWGKTPFVTESVRMGTAAALATIEVVRQAATPEAIETRLAREEAKLQRLREQPYAPGRRTRLPPSVIREQEQVVEGLKKEIAAREALEKQQQEQARAGEAAAKLEETREAIAGIRGELTKSLEGVATPAEQIAWINQELAETKARLEGLRRPETATDVDAEIRHAEDLARRKITQIRESMRREAEAAGREARRNLEVIEDLRRQGLKTTDPRQASIEAALARLSEGASAAQRRQVVELAGANYDQAKAQEEANKRQEEAQRIIEGSRTLLEDYQQQVERIHDLHQRKLLTDKQYNKALEKAKEDYDGLAEAAKKVFEETRTPQEKYAERLKKLDELWKADKISADTYNRAVARAREELEDGGWKEAAQDFTRVIGTAFEDAAVKGQGFQVVLQGLAEDMQRIMYRVLVTKPLENAFTRLFAGAGSWLPEWLGGTPAPAPAGKQTGGMISGPGGPRDDLVPILASNGEFVVNARATSMFLPLIAALNEAGLRGYQAGGAVGEASLFSGPPPPRFALGGVFGSPTMRRIDAILTSLGGAFIPTMMANPSGAGFIQRWFGPSLAQRWFPQTLQKWFGAEQATALFGPRTIGGDRYAAAWTRDGGFIERPRFGLGGILGGVAGFLGLGGLGAILGSGQAGNVASSWKTWAPFLLGGTGPGMMALQASGSQVPAWMSAGAGGGGAAAAMFGFGRRDGGPVGTIPRYQMGGEVLPMAMPAPAAPPIIINNSFNIQTPSAESFTRSRLQVEAMMGRSMERALRRGGA